MRRILLIDLFLLAVCLVLGYTLGLTWMNGARWEAEVSLPEVASSGEGGEELPPLAERRTAELEVYKVIGSKNIFRPERKEWTPPPPKPKPKEKPKPKPAAAQPEPTPLPKPVLLGVILSGDKRIAIMQGHRREEVQFKHPRLRSRRWRPRERIVQEPVGRYEVGDTISEAQIVEILEDKVVLERDGERFEVALGAETKAEPEKVRPRPVKRPFVLPSQPQAEMGIPGFKEEETQRPPRRRFPRRRFVPRR